MWRAAKSDGYPGLRYPASSGPRKASKVWRAMGLIVLGHRVCSAGRGRHRTRGDGVVDRDFARAVVAPSGGLTETGIRRQLVSRGRKPCRLHATFDPTCKRQDADEHRLVQHVKGEWPATEARKGIAPGRQWIG